MEQLTKVIDVLSDEELAEIAGGQRCQDCSVLRVDCGIDSTVRAECNPG